MKYHARIVSLVAALAASAAVMPAQAQQPAAAVKLGIVTFLTGPAATPFGIPSRNAAEIVIETLNAGKAPAPFDKVGLGGAKIEAKYVDEAGTVANVVTEFRNLVQRDQVDAIVGYVSSGSCLAVAPVADELKANRMAAAVRPRLIELGERSVTLPRSAVLNAEGVLLQLRSVIVDLLQMTGMGPFEATDALPPF